MAGHRRGRSRRRGRDGNSRAGLADPFAWASVTKLLVALAAPGVLPGFGYQPHCDWGLGFEIRDRKAPHWTGSRNSPRTFGHFGQSGSFLWVDPEARVACASLADRDFGDWAK